MKLHSTKNRELTVGLKEAVLKSLPPDNGLYVPDSINKLPVEFLRELKKRSAAEINHYILAHLLKNDLPKDVLYDITDDAINFPAPIVEIESLIYSLELFHGPTLAFKDFGARFMARLMGYYMRNEDRHLHILVATSGDTGGAVASGFHHVEGITVTILYPSGKVSPLQEKQLTTLGGNIRAIEINGSFDDCQALVKKAFLDEELNKKLLLSSANSINIARLIPQTLYYFHAYAQLPSEDLPVYISVPSGNFGNITGGLMAKKLGLAVEKFIASTNINDTFPKYLESGSYEPIQSIPTISNAMDVGDPSNFQRIMYFYNNDLTAVQSDIHSRSYTDEVTKHTLSQVLDKTGYLMDPHGAVGYKGLTDFLKERKAERAYGIFLETAHPSKFLEVVEDITSKKVKIPERLAILENQAKVAEYMEYDYEKFREFLLR